MKKEQLVHKREIDVQHQVLISQKLILTEKQTAQALQKSHHAQKMKKKLVVVNQLLNHHVVKVKLQKRMSLHVVKLLLNHHVVKVKLQTKRLAMIVKQ